MINSEHDLWQLFGGEGPDVPGKQERTFNELHDLTTVLDVGQKKRNRPYRPRFKLTDQTRFYRLRCLDVEAVVDQSRLFTTANKIGNPELRIAFLGGRVSLRLQVVDSSASLEA